MKEKLKKQKGITLIALIITIIVLLILAMVSVKIVTSSGIIKKANDATIKYKLAEIEEALKIQLNEEQIDKTTNKEENNESYTYMQVLEELLGAIEEIPNGQRGYIYDLATGEKLTTSVLNWFPTEIINNNDFTQGNFNLKSLEIQTDLGKKGSFLEYATNESVATTDVFFYDNEYNIYYIDNEGNIYTSKTKYEVDEITLQKTYYALSEEEKIIYNKIYEGALDFTGDKNYAKGIASNDLNPTTTVNTFFFNGYLYSSIMKDNSIVTLEDGTKLERLAELMIHPDGTIVDAFHPGSISYYMDENYRMYKYDNNEKKLYDKNNNVICENFETTDSNPTKIKEITENGKNYEYEYGERFDKRDIVIMSIPDKEIVDIKKDFEGYNVYSIGGFNVNNVKKIILPDTIKTLSILAAGRRMEETSSIDSIFSGCNGLEYLELSNNIAKIYTHTFKNCSSLRTVVMPDKVDEIGKNAFAGCSNVTVKFKDGKAPAGQPWGGNNITITNK